MLSLCEVNKRGAPDQRQLFLRSQPGILNGRLTTTLKRRLQDRRALIKWRDVSGWK
jgi:hypothetical protein